MPGHQGTSLCIDIETAMLSAALTTCVAQRRLLYFDPLNQWSPAFVALGTGAPKRF